MKYQLNKTINNFNKNIYFQNNTLKHLSSFYLSNSFHRWRSIILCVLYIKNLLNEKINIAYGRTTNALVVMTITQQIFENKCTLLPINSKAISFMFGFCLLAIECTYFQRFVV